MAVLRSHAIRTLLLVVLLAAESRFSRAAPVASDLEVKAAFLCSFAEFVEWPTTESADHVTIAVLGTDPFGPLLEETVRTRALQTKTLVLKRVATPDEALRAQIVFVCASEKARLADVLRALSGGGILTVSDIDGFARRGGMVGFVLEQRRVRFEINAEAAEKAGLRVSSRLLNLARLVGPGPAADH